MTDVDPLLERIDQVLAECEEPRPITFTFRQSTDTEIAEMVNDLTRRGPVRITEDGPRFEPPPLAAPMPPSWWQRILGRQP